MKPILVSAPETCVHPRSEIHVIPDTSGVEPCWPIVVCACCGSFQRARHELHLADEAAEGDLGQEHVPRHRRGLERPPSTRGAAEEPGLVPPGPPLTPQEAMAVLAAPNDDPRVEGVPHEEPKAAATPSPIASEARANAPVTVRILQDVPPFVDADHQTRTLKAGDITSLAASTAHLLVRRKKATLVEEVVRA